MLEPITNTDIIRSPRPKHEALRRLEAFRIVGLSHWEPGETWPRMQAISKADPAHFHILSSGWQDVLLIEEPGSLRPADHGNEHVDGPDVQHDACALATVRNVFRSHGCLMLMSKFLRLYPSRHRSPAPSRFAEVEATGKAQPRLRHGRLSILLLSTLVMQGPRAKAQEFDFTGQGTVWANGPGLTCRETTHPTFGYAAPSFSAPRVVRFSLVVAVTGPAVNGFFPVALRSGSAWVPAADTKRPTRLQSCFVRRLRDGRLLYSSHDRIQGD